MGRCRRGPGATGGVRELAGTKDAGTWRQSRPIGGTVGTSGWLEALCACHPCRAGVQRVDIKVLWRRSLPGARFPRPSTARGLPRSRVACASPAPTLPPFPSPPASFLARNPWQLHNPSVHIDWRRVEDKITVAHGSARPVQLAGGPRGSGLRRRSALAVCRRRPCADGAPERLAADR